MKKRILAVLMSLVMLVGLMPVTAMAEETEQGGNTPMMAELPDKWDGCISCSEENPHMIKTTADLNKIRTHLVNGKTTGYFKLANDITFLEVDFKEGGDFYNGGKGFEPIGVYQKPASEGTETHSFSAAVFDGANHKISGIVINNDGSYGPFTGLFSHVNSGSVIKNLILENCNVVNLFKTGQHVGVLAGYVHGEKTKIENCAVVNSSTVNKSETSAAHSNGAGAIAGRLCTGPTVERCIVDNVTVNGLSSAGGIAGVIAGATIRDCTLVGVDIIGCLVGSLTGNLQSGTTVDAVIAEGINIGLQAEKNVSKLVMLGGAVGHGYNSPSTFKNTFIKATIDMKDTVAVADKAGDGQNVYVGGMVAREQLWDTFENCYVDVSFKNVPSDKGSTCFVATFAAISNQASEVLDSSFKNCIYVENDSAIPALISVKGTVGATTTLVALHKNLNLVYGTNSYILGDAALADSGVVFVSDNTNVVTVANDGTVIPTKVGTANITAEITLNKQTKILAKTAVTVVAKDVAVDMTDKAVDYDGDTKTIDAVVTDKPTDLKLAYSYKAESDNEYTKVAPIAPGTYIVKVESGNSNYNLTGKTTAMLTINAGVKTDVSSQAKVTEPDSLVYSGTAKEYSAVCSGISAISATYFDEAGNELVDVPVNAGKYSVTLVGSNDISYVVKTIDFEIKKAELTATYVSERVRQGRTPAYEVVIDGFVNEETATVLSKVPTVEKGHTGRGTYTLTPFGGEATNYTFDYVAGTLTIYKKSSSSDDSSTGSSSSTFTKNDVSVDEGANGSIKLDTEEAKKGDTVTITVKPDKGYELDELTVTDEDGNEIKLKDKGDGKYTFTMPDSEVEIEATFEEVEDAFAEDTKPAEEKSIVLTVGSTVATVDGTSVVNDVAPIIRNDRTMLPIRFIAEALGAEVSWNETESKVTIAKGDTVIEIYIGQPYALVNGTPVQLDAPAFIENDRTYLPLRFVAENLGAAVTWDANTNTVTIIPSK